MLSSRRSRSWSSVSPTSRSEEHTSELQSRLHLVCRLLLEKKKNTCEHQQRLHRERHLMAEDQRTERTTNVHTERAPHHQRNHVQLVNLTRCQRELLTDVG